MLYRLTKHKNIIMINKNLKYINRKNICSIITKIPKVTFSIFQALVAQKLSL